MLFGEELAKADWNALKQISQEEIVSELLDTYPSLSKDAVQKYLDDYLKEQ